MPPDQGAPVLGNLGEPCGPLLPSSERQNLGSVLAGFHSAVTGLEIRYFLTGFSVMSFLH